MKYQIVDKVKSGDRVCNHHRAILGLKEQDLKPFHKQKERLVLCDCINCLDDAEYVIT